MSARPVGRSHDEAGFILATLLVFAVVLSLTAFLAAKLTRTDIQLVNTLQNEKKALGLAEAGVAEALYRLSLVSPANVRITGVNGSAGFDASLAPLPQPTPSVLPSGAYQWGLSPSVTASTAQILLSTSGPAKTGNGTTTNDVTTPTLQPTSARLLYSNTASDLTSGSTTLTLRWAQNGASIRTYQPSGTPTVSPRKVVKITSVGRSGTAQRTVTAYAADFPTGSPALVLLGGGCPVGGSSGGITSSGNATINVTGLVAVNAGYTNSGALCTSAINPNGSLYLTATGVDVVGQASTTNNTTYSPTPENNQIPAVDPYSNLSVTAPSSSGLSVRGSGSANGPQNTNVNGGSMLPGIYYGGATLSGTVAMTPGTYYMAGSSGFTVSNSATVTCPTCTSANGVVIRLTNDTARPNGNGNYGPLSIGNSASLNLSATSNGLLVYQDLANTNAISVSGATSLSLGGAIYAPGATALSVQGNANFTFNNYIYTPKANVSLSGGSGSSAVTINGVFVGQQLSTSGGWTVNVNAPSTTGGAGGPYRVIAWQDY